MTDSLSGQNNFPRHIAIIMDGNNRWAQERGLDGAKGHGAGVVALREIARACADYNVIEILTVFAFSSENWSRPDEEIEALMGLLLAALIEEIPELNKNHVRMEIIGDRSQFSEPLQKQMAEAEALTAHNNKMLLAVALNYGGRWDILNATKELAKSVKRGELEADNISEQDFEQHLCLGQYPMPDLCIRTGKEQRISNFLLWQITYSEIYFSDRYWPDFDPAHLANIITWYQKRQRRFGGRSEDSNGIASSSAKLDLNKNPNAD